MLDTVSIGSNDAPSLPPVSRQATAGVTLPVMARRTRDCLHCGNPFPVKPRAFGGGQPQLYCTRKCRAEHHHTKARAKARRERQEAREDAEEVVEVVPSAAKAAKAAADAKAAAASAASAAPRARLPNTSNAFTDARRANATRAIAASREDGDGRTGHPATSEVGYDEEQFQFLKAVERYRRERKRPFPGATELLAIAVSLGYRKVAEATELPGVRGSRGEAGDAGER